LVSTAWARHTHNAGTACTPKGKLARRGVRPGVGARVRVRVRVWAWAWGTLTT